MATLCDFVYPGGRADPAVAGGGKLDVGTSPGGTGGRTAGFSGDIIGVSDSFVVCDESCGTPDVTVGAGALFAMTGGGGTGSERTVGL